jgi:hypothetical protein
MVISCICITKIKVQIFLLPFNLNNYLNIKKMYAGFNSLVGKE